MKMQLPQSIYRWILLLIAVMVYLYIGYNESKFHNYLGDVLYAFFNTSNDKTFFLLPHARIITFLFHFCYAGLSMVIIHLFVKNKNITTIFSIFLFFTYALTFSSNEIGKILNFEPLRITAYRMMTLMISPLPLLIFLPYLLKKNNTQIFTKEKYNKIIKQ